MSTITVKDGTTIYYKDWGKGPVVTFSHGWPLCSDAWDGQMHFFGRERFPGGRPRPARSWPLPARLGLPTT
jgi:pimeloyl-ACP methyl ester carboxylesterase